MFRNWKANTEHNFQSRPPGNTHIMEARPADVGKTLAPLILGYKYFVWLQTFEKDLKFCKCSLLQQAKKKKK